MKSFNILSFILGFILISCILSQTINIEVSTELEDLDFTNETSSSKTFKVSISPNCTVNFGKIGVWHSGCSIQIHRMGEYGVVYNYTFPPSDDGHMTLCILEIKNLRWFHWPDL